MKRFTWLIAYILIATTSFAQAHFKEVSHYLFPQFTLGVILMEDGETRRAMLNYNRLTEEMVFAGRQHNFAITQEETEKIEQIHIANRRFFVHEGNFVEMIYSNGIRLYADYKARINDPGRAAGYGMRSQTAVSSRYLRLTLPTEVYNLELPSDLVPIPYTQYWLYKDGAYHEISNIGHLRRVYPNKREAFRNFPGLNDMDFNEPSNILRLIKHIEGIE